MDFKIVFCILCVAILLVHATEEQFQAERKAEKEKQEKKDLKDTFNVLGSQGKEIPVSDSGLRTFFRDLLNGEDIAEKELDDIIREVDTDGSRSIDFEEFKRFMLPE